METNGITRRDLLKIGAVGAVGGALTISGLAKMAADAGQAEAAVGAAAGGSRLADPGELALTTLAGGVREGSLTVAETDLRLGGSAARLLAYNGVVPGPLVRVRSGDALRLHLRNELAGGGANSLGEPRGVTNLHTHGWHVSPADPADNVMRRLDPGDSWTYTYDLGRQRAGTLGWYHPHVHGLVAEQLWGGLAGPLVVEDPTDALSGYETHVLVLKDFTS
jgi:FtsP/CotA-like multicopper oxidase with cupredoxin domain